MTDERDVQSLHEQIDELTLITRNQAQEIHALQTALLEILEMTQEKEVAEDYYRIYMKKTKQIAVKALPRFRHYAEAGVKRFGRKQFDDEP